MQELISINKTVIGNEEVNSVDARELHTFLESKQQFADWIKSKVIDNAFFKKEFDWIELDLSLRNSMKQKGGQNRKDYALTIDTAKKVAMAEQTAKGEEVRDYFIQCEKALKEIVESVFTSITDSLAKGDTVRINGVGTFGTAATAARTGRNPSTGEALEIPASTRVSFKAASALKKAVKA